jgi:2-haloacid dehalogenase
VIKLAIRALIFDVFGTCVDWRTSVAREVAAVLPGVDAYAFADAWRGEYQPAMERIRAGKRGYVALDDLHLENLARVLEMFGAACADPNALNRAWEKLNPWPDVSPGLKELKKLALIAPCSNGSIAMMARLARYGDLPWDCVLGADIARDYKPNAEVYLASARALRLAPKEIMMVAAHNDDLEAAQNAGLKTAFVPRPTEHGDAQHTDLCPSENWTIVAQDFLDLARRTCPQCSN